MLRRNGRSVRLERHLDTTREPGYEIIKKRRYDAADEAHDAVANRKHENRGDAESKSKRVRTRALADGAGQRRERQPENRKD